jgi:hypothetical protein
MKKSQVFIYAGLIVGVGSAALRLTGLNPEVSMAASVVCASIFLIYKLKFNKTAEVGPSSDTNDK